MTGGASGEASRVDASSAASGGRLASEVAPVPPAPEVAPPMPEPALAVVLDVNGCDPPGPTSSGVEVEPPHAMMGASSENKRVGDWRAMVASTPKKDRPS